MEEKERVERMASRLTGCPLSDTAEPPNCPIPATHRRLSEAHLLWHQTEAAYHDPTGFRANLNATIQASRNVTWALQSEKHHVPAFDEWYTPLQASLKLDPLMKWLNDARIQVVKKGDLETKSIARVSLNTWDELDLGTMDVPPFMRAEKLAVYLGKQKTLPVPPGFEESVLCVERRWIVSQLPDREILDVLSHCLVQLGRINADAHRQTGKSTSCQLETERPACMADAGEARKAWVHLAAEELIQSTIAVFPYSDAVARKARKRYGPAPTGKALPPIRDVTDVFGVAEWVNECAKVILRKDGKHVPMAFLCHAGDGLTTLALNIPDTESKYVAIRQVASAVSSTRAIGVVLVNEIWWIPKDQDTGLRAGLSPNRQEGLSVIAAASDLKSRYYMTPFTRTELGKINIGKTDATDDYDAAHTGMLRPIMEVWRQQGAPPPGIPLRSP